MTSDGTLQYGWDAQNHLKSAAGVNYLYDGSGERVAKSTNELTWYTPDGKPIAETDASGNNLHEFIYFNSRLIARRDPNGNVNFYFSDHLHSNRVLTDATGHALQSTIYLPYG